MEKFNKFEKARIISSRSLQISMDAPILVKISKNDHNPITISRDEFKKEVIPITIKRD